MVDASFLGAPKHAANFGGNLTFGSTGMLAGNMTTDLNGNSTGFEVTVQNGSADLGGATLDVTPTINSTPNQVFTIINVTGTLSGQFGNLADGAVIGTAAAQIGNQAINSQYLTLGYHYQSGTVTLTGLDIRPDMNVQINDGSAQRSELTLITITYSVPVTFMGGAANVFTLAHLSGLNAAVLTGNHNVALSATTSQSGGHTVVTLTFSGPETDATSLSDSHGARGQLSLSDGVYQLSSGTYTSPTDTLNGTGLRLFRLFGDGTGNGIVDATDLALFRTTYNASIGMAEFLYYFDSDNSGTVDSMDLGQFRTRFNVNVFLI